MKAESEGILRIFRRQSPVTVLGPGNRAVIWVQGCGFACQGCIVPESWNREGGEAVAILELATWILAQPEIEGITLSGGEPMLQASALVELIDTVRQVRDLGVMCYTGYRLEQLQQQGTVSQQVLLQRLDLLIDGTYIQSQHGDLLWRGSTNQRLILLTQRYLSILKQRLAEGDKSAGLEFYTDIMGEFYFTGVPSQPGFRTEFEARMLSRGVVIKA